MQNARHLRLGLTPGSGVRHPQRQRNAEGGVEQVPILGAQRLVQVHGKTVIPRYQGIQFPWRQFRSAQALSLGARHIAGWHSSTARAQENGDGGQQTGVIE